MKHIPQRMCIVCRQSKDKSELYKLKNEQNTVNIDETNFSAGRSCYICKNNLCIEKCAKTHTLDKVFRKKINEQSYQNLLEKING